MLQEQWGVRTYLPSNREDKLITDTPVLITAFSQLGRQYNHREQDHRLNNPPVCATRLWFQW